MKSFHKFLAVLLLSSFSWSANAVVLSFDDTPIINFTDTLYNGFNITDGGVLNVNSHPSIWDSAYSGNQIFTNHHFEYATISSTFGAFNFEGAFFHQDNRYPGTTAMLRGYDDSNNLLYSKNVVASGDWTWVAFDWLDVTTVRWHASPNSNIAIDNFTYNQSIEDVAEPSVLALLSLGIACLGLVRRRVMA